MFWDKEAENTSITNPNLLHMTAIRQNYHTPMNTEMSITDGTRLPDTRPGVSDSLTRTSEHPDTDIFRTVRTEFAARDRDGHSSEHHH